MVSRLGPTSAHFPRSGPEMETAPLNAPRDSDINRGLCVVSFGCVGLQLCLLLRHALWPMLARDFHAEPFYATALALLVQITGCAFALGAGSGMLSCMIANITCTMACLLFLWLF